MIASEYVKRALSRGPVAAEYVSFAPDPDRRACKISDKTIRPGASFRKKRLRGAKLENALVVDGAIIADDAPSWQIVISVCF